MIRTLLAALCLFAVSAWAQPAIAPPQAGFMQDAGGWFRPVYGLAGNFLLGEPLIPQGISAAFSGSFGLAKTDSELIVTDSLGETIATSNVPEGSALFAFTVDGKPALVFFFSTNTLLRWDGLTLSRIPLDWTALAADAVLSIAEPDPYHAAMIAQRKDGLWDIRVVLATGEVVTAPACILASGDVVSSDDQGLVIRKTDGSLIHIAALLPPAFALQQMGVGWLQIRDLTNRAQFAVRISKGREGLFLLPEVSQ